MATSPDPKGLQTICGGAEREVCLPRLGTEGIDPTRILLFREIEDAVLRDAGEWIFFFHDGQKIFAQGDPVDSMIIILRGEIQVLSEEMSMVTRRQFDIVGEQAFLSRSASRTADAFARGTVEVLRIPGDVVRRLLETNLQFNRNLLEIVSGKLADATSDRAFRYQNEYRLIAAFNAHLAPEITARLLSSGEEYGNVNSTRTKHVKKAKAITTNSDRLLSGVMYEIRRSSA